MNYHQPTPQGQGQDAYRLVTTPVSAQEERKVAMLTHVVPAVTLVLSAGTLGFVASLVVYLIYKDRGPFVRAAAANSLNVQIWTAVGLLVSWVLMWILIGFVTYPLVIAWAVLLHVIGAMKADKGESYNPALTPRIIR